MDQTPSIVVDGKPVLTDSVYLENGNLMVPLRDLAENLGWTVSWGDEFRKILVKGSEAEVVLRPDDSTAQVSGVSIQMPVPVQLVKDKAFVPLRFICEQMKLKVGYDQENRCAYIFKDDREYHLYAEGREFTLVVSNQSDKPQNYQFNSSKTHDFIIQQEGRTVWSMSGDKVYLTVVSEKTLEPGQCWTYKGSLDKEPTPGTYTLEAWYFGWDGRYYIKDPNPVASISYTIFGPSRK